MKSDCRGSERPDIVTLSSRGSSDSSDSSHSGIEISVCSPLDFCISPPGRFDDLPMPSPKCKDKNNKKHHGKEEGLKMGTKETIWEQIPDSIVEGMGRKQNGYSTRKSVVVHNLHRLVGAVVLLLASMFLLALHLENVVQIFLPVEENRVNMGSIVPSRKNFSKKGHTNSTPKTLRLPKISKDIQIKGVETRSSIDLENGSLQLTEQRDVGSSSNNKNSKETKSKNKRKCLDRECLCRGKMKIRGDDGERVHYCLDEDSLDASRIMMERNKSIQSLARTHFKFVLGVEGDEDDETLEGHNRKFLLCYKRAHIVKENSFNTKGQYSTASVANDGRKSSKKNTLGRSNTRKVIYERQKREAAYQKALEEALARGNVEDGGDGGRCISANLQELRTHHFHHDVIDDLHYNEGSGSPYLRQVYDFQS